MERVPAVRVFVMNAVTNIISSNKFASQRLRNYLSKTIEMHKYPFVPNASDWVYEGYKDSKSWSLLKTAF